MLPRLTSIWIIQWKSDIELIYNSEKIIGNHFAVIEDNDPKDVAILEFIKEIARSHEVKLIRNGLRKDPVPLIPNAYD